MIKLKKELQEIKNSILALSKRLELLEGQGSKPEKDTSLSYKEVIDEWINGKEH